MPPAPALHENPKLLLPELNQNAQLANHAIGTSLLARFHSLCEIQETLLLSEVSGPSALKYEKPDYIFND
jgi:hypothetical protein